MRPAPKDEAAAPLPAPVGMASGVAVATEVPVALVYGGISHVVMMASPADLEDFAFGFSLTEGIVAGAGEIRDLDIHSVPGGIEIALSIPPRRMEALKGRRRNLAGRTGCGLCGVEAIGEAVRRFPPVAEGIPVTEDAVARALSDLAAHQPLNARVHALHAAAWAGADGTVAMAREDVGRHNALDKLIGARARAGLGFVDGFLVATSRCSVEMVQKAAAMGAPMLVTVSAPTSLAISEAEAAGLTLVAGAAPGRRLAFTHPARLLAGGRHG